ncbi:hypothetical protein HW126_20825, partial [Salinispora sp. H7-4]|nr:hypothetical protein [Salinispora sp. H7-4]
ESRMNNLNCGDRDSLGVFQQMEPGMEGSTAGQLAQAVQRSAFPSRYDEAEEIARALREEA